MSYQACSNYVFIAKKRNLKHAYTTVTNQNGDDHTSSTMSMEGEGLPYLEGDNTVTGTLKSGPLKPPEVSTPWTCNGREGGACHTNGSV